MPGATSLSDWQSGAWASLAGDEWGHNTKERSGIHGMTYMYQRWYSPETGKFLSKAPYGPDQEHQYGFLENDPTSAVDPKGEKLVKCGGNSEAANNAIDKCLDMAKKCNRALRQMIESLESSDNHHGVCYRGGRGSWAYPTVGNGSMVNVNPGQAGQYCGTNSCAILIHELAHSSRIDRRELDVIRPPSGAGFPNGEEEIAVGYENLARSCMGLPQRPDYNTIP